MEQLQLVLRAHLLRPRVRERLFARRLLRRKLFEPPLLRLARLLGVLGLLFGVLHHLTLHVGIILHAVVLLVFEAHRPAAAGHDARVAAEGPRGRVVDAHQQCRQHGHVLGSF